MTTLERNSSGKREGQGPVAPDRRSALRFALLLGLCMLVFNVAVYRGGLGDRLWQPYLALNAALAATALDMAGYHAKAQGTTLSGPRFTMEVATGCDGLQASSFFVFAVVLSPVGVAIRRRLPWLGVGLLVLAAVNLFRVASLYVVGVHFVHSFDFIHGEVWQLIFILLPLTLWLAWLHRVRSADLRGSRHARH